MLEYSPFIFRQIGPGKPLPITLLSIIEMGQAPLLELVIQTSSADSNSSTVIVVSMQGIDARLAIDNFITRDTAKDIVLE